MLIQKAVTDRNIVMSLKPRGYSQIVIEERQPYSMSTWGRVLVNPRYKDPVDKKGGILFRRQFRVSYPIFEQIVGITGENRRFSDAPDCTGRRGAPLELKILEILRVLDRAYCFDGIEELCFISAEVIRDFFHKFTRLFSVK